MLQHHTSDVTTPLNSVLKYLLSATIYTVLFQLAEGVAPDKHINRILRFKQYVKGNKPTGEYIKRIIQGLTGRLPEIPTAVTLFEDQYFLATPSPTFGKFLLDCIEWYNFPFFAKGGLRMQQIVLLQNLTSNQLDYDDLAQIARSRPTQEKQPIVGTTITQGGVVGHRSYDRVSGDRFLRNLKTVMAKKAYKVKRLQKELKKKKEKKKRN